MRRKNEGGWEKRGGEMKKIEKDAKEK